MPIRLMGNAPTAMAALLFMGSAVTLIAGCGQSAPASAIGQLPAPTQTVESARSAGPDEVLMVAGNRFDPADLEVPLGTTVSWTNVDGTAHVVDWRPGISPIVAPRETYRRTFDVPGVYDYICSVPGHEATMQGTITVTD